MAAKNGFISAGQVRRISTIPNGNSWGIEVEERAAEEGQDASPRLH
jgi:hypothetical protein